MVLIKNVYTPVICKTTKSPTVIEWTTFPIVWTQQMVVFELFQPKKININLELYRLSRTQTLTKKHMVEKGNL